MKCFLIIFIAVSVIMEGKAETSENPEDPIIEDAQKDSDDANVEVPPPPPADEVEDEKNAETKVDPKSYRRNSKNKGAKSHKNVKKQNHGRLNEGHNSFKLKQQKNVDNYNHYKNYDNANSLNANDGRSAYSNNAALFNPYNRGGWSPYGGYYGQQPNYY
uniref:Uncharacterized protein n=1 Tax=Strigamia maritima TaxID=126957 RepID=T1IRV7_STRMM